MSPAEDCAERLRELAKHVLDIRPLSRTRPHIFEESKQEAARRIRQIATEIKDIGRLPARALPGRFQPGPIVSSAGRVVRVEVRRRAA